MEYKAVLGFIAAIINLVAFYPYFSDLFRGKTQPHIYTWIIWTITQGTATAGLWYGGGMWGGLALSIGVFFEFAVVVLSLKYGTKNITLGDTAVLIAALIGISFWWTLKSPELSVVTVTALDMLGYWPTFRKSFREPWSETISTWTAFTLADTLSLFALNAFNVLTATYLVAITIANLLLVALYLWRRQYIPRLAK